MTIRRRVWYEAVSLMVKIDSHQHFWALGKFDYPWLTPDLVVLYRDHLPNDLVPLLRGAGIEKTIVVQASPTVAETNWILQLAERNDFIGGVVGWLDLESPAFAEELDRYRRKRMFVGIRPAVEFLPDDAWLVRPRVLESIALIAEAQLPMDLVVWPRHLPAVVQMLERVPDLRCVVDHLAKPDVRHREREPWRNLIAEVARHPNAHCKLSGILTMADHRHWNVRDVQPYVDHVLDCFGGERVMYGSDWPVSLLASSYEQTLGVLKEAASATGDVDEAALFGGNAARFYRLIDC